MANVEWTHLFLLFILVNAHAWHGAASVGYPSAQDLVTRAKSIPGLPVDQGYNNHLDKDSLSDTSHLDTSDYGDDDDSYHEDYYDDAASIDGQASQLPPPHQGFPKAPVVRKSGRTKEVTSRPIQTMCAYYNSKEPQIWKRGKGGTWKRGKGRVRKKKRRNGNNRWRRRILDDHIQCERSCFTLWAMDSINSTSVKIMKQGCSNSYCDARRCQENMSTFNMANNDYVCCCNSEGCNAVAAFLPQAAAKLATQGMAALTNGQARSETKEEKGDNPAGGYKATDPLSRGRKQHRAGVASPVWPNEPLDGRFVCAYTGNHHKNRKSPYEPGVSQSQPGEGIHLNKRYHPHKEGDGEPDSGVMFPWSSGRGNPAIGRLQSNSTVICRKDSFCYTLWESDENNKSNVFVQRQGCWLSSDKYACLEEACESTYPPRQNNLHFCCCSGHKCNTRFRDVYDPSKQPKRLSTTSPPAAATFGPIHDHSYREKTIIVALVLFLAVSIVTVLGYLVCRLCLTSKRATPLSSSAGTRTDTDLGEGSLGPSTPQFNLDDLKVLDLIVRGRYSEVRRGSLNGKDVAVKIYQHHHRQYFFNERSAFTLPFMENDNLVKFFGTAERTIDTADGTSGYEGQGHESDLTLGLGGGGICISQYLVVTELAPLGSLTGYLKHNTLDWYHLCRMCQGICAGLVHLHSDITKTSLGLFKPAIAHRDINTRNILVKSDLTCVLADLGFAVGIMGSKIIRNGVAEVAEQCSLPDVGTLRYMAPEVFDGAVNLRDCEASLKQIDVYALGLVLWEVASRCVDLYQGAPLPDYQLPFQAEAGSHPLFEELQVLVVKYKTRPKFPEVWKDTHPAVRSLKETIEDCWDSDADARLTALCVQERIADMATLWMQGSNRKRDVMPTLNTDLWPSASRSSNLTAIPGVVSNGVSVLPLFVEDGSTVQHGSTVLIQDAYARDRVRGLGIESEPALTYQAITRSAGNRSELVQGYTENFEDEENEDAAVTAPLIDSNLSQLATRVDEESSSDDRKRVREWIQEQSMSGSTMDTLLPLTPLSDRYQNLIDCDNDESLHAGQGVSPSTFPMPQAQPQAAVKANNVMLAQRKGVISHPNQGRNPTVERNTHKRSDEELAVQGNQLIGTLDSRSSGGSETLGPLAKRKGSIEAQNAREAARGEHQDGNLEGIDSGGELSSLVQHDLLNDSRAHQQPARNAPIPYVQNQVHMGESSVPGSQSGMMRPKLANMSAGTNRSSYSHPPARDGNNLTGGNRGFSVSYPQCGSNPLALSVEKGDDSSESKSLKNMLGKFIRPKDLGHKFSMLIFGGGKKKNTEQGNHTKQGNGNVYAVSATDFPLGGFHQTGSNGTTQISRHYDNSGLETSPQGRGSNPEGRVAGAGVPMQVKLHNGAAVTSTCCPVPSIPAPGVTCNRLPNTDVRQGSFGDPHFQSPTLFTNQPHSGISASLRGDNFHNDHDNFNPNTTHLQQQAPEKARANHNYMLSNEHFNQADQSVEFSSVPVHDQNHNTHTHSAIAASLPNAKPSTPICDVLVEMDNFSKYKHNTMGMASDYHTPCEPVAAASILSFNSFTDSSSHSKPHNVNINLSQEMASKGLAGYLSHDTKGGNSVMYNVDTESNCVVDREDPQLPNIFQQVQTSASIHTALEQANLSEPGVKDVSTIKPSRLSDPQEQPVLRHNKHNKVVERVSEPESTAGLCMDPSSHPESGAAKRPDLDIVDTRPVRLGMSCSWHEDGQRDLSGNPQCRPRPKSLSLKGHNYERKSQPKVIAKAASDKVSSASSLKLTCDTHSKPLSAVDSVETKNSMGGTKIAKAANIQNCRSKVTKGRNSGWTSHGDSINGHSTHAMAAPNVTMGLSTSSSGVFTNGHVEQGSLPSVSLPSGSSERTSCQSSSIQAQSFRPIEASGHLSTNQDLVLREEVVNPKNRALFSSCSHGHLASVDAASPGHVTSRSSPKNRGSLREMLSDKGDAEEAKIRRVGSTSSDSSEKIRRRIKTPVSFKNGRLSLYDDRLMTQSLDSAVLYSVSGEEL